MERSRLLNSILKIQIIREDEKPEVLGTAFLINSDYAITAQHVIEKCNNRKFFLQTNDNKYTITDLEVECGLKIKEKGIDIAIIKLNTGDSFFNQIFNLCKDSIKYMDEYQTYGYPEINQFRAHFISGNIISPEGRMSIENSTGDHIQIKLYRGVSGAPLIIKNRIYGVISDEGVTTRASKPELFSSNFSDIIEYLETLGDYLDDNHEKLCKFLIKYCEEGAVVSHNLDPHYKMYDEEYSKIKDKRNLSEKVLSVCPEFNNAILEIWNKKCVRARYELESINISSERKKSLIMAVFIPCIDYIGEELVDSTISSEADLKECIRVLKSKVIEYVNDRKKDYNYGVENTTILENTIFNLIDSCFLSFDSYLKEDCDAI